MEARRGAVKERLRSFTAKQDGKVQSMLLRDSVRRKLENCLSVDDTVYSIVDSLRDLQAITAGKLFQQRVDKLEKAKSGGKSQATASAVEAEFDRHIVKQFDEMVKEQQSTLSCAGLPLFKVTNDRDVIRAQMAVIDFILLTKDLYAE